MKKYLLVGLILVMAAALLGCEAVYDDYPPPAPVAPAPAPPQQEPFIVIDDPDWEQNQGPMAYGNVPPGMVYGNQMEQPYGGQQMIYPGQGGEQMMMVPPGQQPMIYPQGNQQMMMAPPGQQQMMMAPPGQQQMMYSPQGQPQMMFDENSNEPPGVIYEMPGGQGQQPIIYPQGYAPDAGGMYEDDDMDFDEIG